MSNRKRGMSSNQRWMACNNNTKDIIAMMPSIKPNAVGIFDKQDKVRICYTVFLVQFEKVIIFSRFYQ